MARTLNRFESAKDKFWGTMSQSPIKEACAEFFGTFVLVVLGDGVMASCVLGRLNLNSVIVGAIGWGLAVMIAVAIAGGVSGGHVNPAVTIGLFSVKKFPFKHIVAYVVAQYIGSFLAAGVVYTSYIEPIELYDGGVRQIPPSINSTAEIFATYPQDFASPMTCFLDQVFATALLLIIICAATDSKNLRVPLHYQPIIIGLGVTAVILAFGHNCGAPLNPARDLAPRIFTAICGWGEGVFSYRNYNWFWIPVIAPHVGGIIGAHLYKMLIEMPSQSRTQEMENCGLPNDGRRRNGLETDSPNISVDVSCEDSAYRNVIDTAVREARLAANTCVPVNLMKQDIADVV